MAKLAALFVTRQEYERALDDAMFIAVQQTGSEPYGSAWVYRTSARTRRLFLPLSLGLLGDDVLCDGLRFRDECGQGVTILGNPPFSA